jgi:hypothetical protein
MPSKTGRSSNTYKVDFKPELVQRHKEGHFILVKGEIHLKKTIVKVNVPNISVPNFTKHIVMELKSQIEPNTVIVEDFNTPLTPTDSSSRQK